MEREVLNLHIFHDEAITCAGDDGIQWRNVAKWWSSSARTTVRWQDTAIPQSMATMRWHDFDEVMNYRVTTSALQHVCLKITGAIVGPTLGNGLCCWQPVIVGVLTLAQLWSNTDVSTVVVLLLSQCKPYNYAPTVGQHMLADYNRVVFLNIFRVCKTM